VHGTKPSIIDAISCTSRTLTTLSLFRSQAFRSCARRAAGKPNTRCAYRTARSVLRETKRPPRVIDGVLAHIVMKPRIAAFTSVSDISAQRTAGGCHRCRQSVPATEFITFDRGERHTSLQPAACLHTVPVYLVMRQRRSGQQTQGNPGEHAQTICDGIIDVRCPARRKLLAALHDRA